jgi:hypothetical protein
MFVISNSNQSKFFGTNFNGAANLPRWVDNKEVAYLFETIPAAIDGEDRLEDFVKSTCEVPYICHFETLQPLTNDELRPYY